MKMPSKSMLTYFPKHVNIFGYRCQHLWEYVSTIFGKVNLSAWKVCFGRQNQSTAKGVGKCHRKSGTQVKTKGKACVDALPFVFYFLPSESRLPEVLCAHVYIIWYMPIYNKVYETPTRHSSHSPWNTKASC